MNRTSLTALACSSLLLFARGTAAQIAIDASNVTLDFTGFTGSGIVPTPAQGQLSSLAWSVTGLSDGNLDFGGTGLGGDFARGISTGGATTGGIYAFDTGSNIALGIQPTDNDFTPGALTARFKNDLTRPLRNVSVSYTVWVFADEAHSSSFDFSWSTDNVTFTSVPALDFTTFGPIPTTPEWRSYPQTTTLSLDVPTNGYLFLRFTSDDAGGTGGRDEIALDDLTLHVNAVCGDGYAEGSEECDDGNQSNTDGCLTTCMLAKCGDGYLEQGVEQCDATSSSPVEPACCSLACQFTEGTSCTGGLCHAGQCIPSGTGGTAGGGGTAGTGTTAGGGGTAGTFGAGGSNASGEAGQSGEGGVTGESGAAGASGEPVLGGTGGVTQGEGGRAHAGTGARPPKGFAGTSGTSSEQGGSAGRGTVGTGGSAPAGGTNAHGGKAGAATNGGKAGSHGDTASKPASDDSGGCGCKMPARSRPDGWALASALGVLGLVRRRRRARRAPS